MFDEADVPTDLLAQAKEYTDTAIICIFRYSAENKNRRNDGTDTYFYLTEQEQKMVKTVSENWEISRHRCGHI